jgi:hypothetical protein
MKTADERLIQNFLDMFIAFLVILTVESAGWLGPRRGAALGKWSGIAESRLVARADARVGVAGFPQNL